MEDKTNVKCENVEQTRDREGENETCRCRTAHESQGCSENWGLQLSGAFVSPWIQSKHVCGRGRGSRDTNQ